MMDEPTNTADVETAVATDAATDVVDSNILIEDVSIDGMCGVY